MHSNPDFDTQELYNLQRSLRFHLLLPKITAHLCLLAMQDTSLAGVPGQVRWDPPSNTGTNSGCKTYHFLLKLISWTQRLKPHEPLQVMTGASTESGL